MEGLRKEDLRVRIGLAKLLDFPQISMNHPWLVRWALWVHLKNRRIRGEKRRSNGQIQVSQ